MKQKHWEVSVFDNTSKTIRNDTLYTTDTEVYLVFELIDEGFTPDTATVTIYNIYGTATVNENVDIVNGIVNYEMPEDAIGHTGGWRTQVVFTKDNEDYTTTVIEFDVDGHLLDNNKPTIVYIENWNRFIKHGEGLVDDWEQLEKIRQANERKRESAESLRKNIFETNETSRQTNELVREENELTRESAETVRVSNEEERVSKDSERDSKIDSKADVSELELYAKKEQEDWIEPTMLNGWRGTTHVTFPPIRYMKDNLGFVHISGALQDGVTAEIFRLPVGYRPSNSQVPVYAKQQWNHGGGVWVQINPNGRVGISSNTLPTDTRLFFSCSFYAG